MKTLILYQISYNLEMFSKVFCEMFGNMNNINEFIPGMKWESCCKTPDEQFDYTLDPSDALDAILSDNEEMFPTLSNQQDCSDYSGACRDTGSYLEPGPRLPYALALSSNNRNIDKNILAEKAQAVPQVPGFNDKFVPRDNTALNVSCETKNHDNKNAPFFHKQRTNSQISYQNAREFPSETSMFEKMTTGLPARGETVHNSYNKNFYTSTKADKPLENKTWIPHQEMPNVQSTQRNVGEHLMDSGEHLMDSGDSGFAVKRFAQIYEMNKDGQRTFVVMADHQDGQSVNMLLETLSHTIEMKSSNSKPQSFSDASSLTTGYCVFCKKNGEQANVYSSHTLRNPNREIVCPVLIKHRCENCGATGPQAHTITYCPLLTHNSNGKRPPSTSVIVKSSMRKSTGRLRDPRIQHHK